MSQKELEKHLKLALSEIGPIEPWWSDEDGMYVFEHDSYPRVMHADPDIEETKAGYLRAITGFIEDRLNGMISESAERVTKGRGGHRPGSGRPKGTKKPKTKRVTLPLEVADWLEEDDHLSQVKQLMQA